MFSLAHQPDVRVHEDVCRLYRLLHALRVVEERPDSLCGQYARGIA